jgi:hypothetical protein
MPRRLVTEEELCQLVNSELTQYEACRGCAIGGVRKLERPRDDGCNWDTHALAVQHRIGQSCLPVFAQTIRLLQSLCNLV